ncbi:MAG: PIN domain-containing protein [Leptolyngbyaceae bacterium]|nr:PIN domain-containing protein [Leptolyngbyaceae bacterium]
MAQEPEPHSQNCGDSPRVLLIDLENCPAQIKQLQQNLERFSQVVICYARTGAKIPLDWLIPLSSTVSSNRLKIFKMTNGGKNAADFGICFFAGALMQELPANTHFVIISNDKDLDHVIHLLKSQGRSAERVGSLEKDKSITEDAPENDVKEANSEPSSIASPLNIYCAHLITYSKNRPAKQDTLLNSIKNKFKNTPVVPQEVLTLLVKQGAVKISENKVAYHNQKIKELANQP